MQLCCIIYVFELRICRLGCCSYWLNFQPWVPRPSMACWYVVTCFLDRLGGMAGGWEAVTLSSVWPQPVQHICLSGGIIWYQTPSQNSGRLWTWLIWNRTKWRVMLTTCTRPPNIGWLRLRYWRTVMEDMPRDKPMETGLTIMSSMG